MSIEISVHPKDGEKRLSGIDLVEATIHNSSIPIPGSPNKRFIFSNINLERCKHWSCFVHGAVISDCTVKGLTGGKGVPTYLWSCLYKNVKISGKVSGIQFKWQLDPDQQELDERFRDDAKDFYEAI